MKTNTVCGHPLIDVVLWIWFAFTALAVAYVAYYQFKGGPEQKENSLAMKTMRWGWVLLTLYTGPFGFIVYWFLHRAPARETPEQSQPSLWEQSVESTIHCVAGDATGILIAVVVTSWLRPPMGVELIAEYVAGIAVGLFLFQALCIKSTFDGSYWRAVRGALLPETLSMNAVMAGMIPVMIILMSRDMSAMEPTSVRFWGTMSLGFVVSTVATFPVNWWLVERGLKYGMGGEERACLRHTVSAASKLIAVVLTLAMLAVGIILAARYGNFSMRAGESMDKKPMSSRASEESRLIGHSEEVTRAVLYRMSDETAYVTGTTLLIDGGMTPYSRFIGQALLANLFEPMNKYSTAFGASKSAALKLVAQTSGESNYECTCD